MQFAHENDVFRALVGVEANQLETLTDVVMAFAGVERG
jgi:hypothetical protein